MARYTMRIWLPDHPGVLGAVTTRLGEIGGNVTGLEVLERDHGVAVDELTVELDDGSRSDELWTSVGRVEGAGVEEVRPVPPGAEERGLAVMAAAVAILEAPTAPVALDTLADAARALFALTWTVLADLSAGEYVHAEGPVPDLDWFCAFCTGVRSVTLGTDTGGSGVLAAELLNAGLTLGAGRSTPFRRREARELELLVRITDRVWAALHRGPLLAPRVTPAG